jgi:hypothetical protein
MLIALIPAIWFGIRDRPTPNLTYVGVSGSTDSGKVNPDFIAAFEDRPTLRLFERAVSRAEKQPGDVIARTPDFDAELRYSDGSVKGLHLWLSPASSAGSIMDVRDTGTMYKLPKDMAIDLIRLLEPYMKQTPDAEQAPDAKPFPDAERVPAAGDPAPLPSADPDADKPPAYRDASIFSIVARDMPITIGVWEDEMDLEAILGPPVAQTVDVLGDNADTHAGSYVKKMVYDGLQLEWFSPKQNGETYWIMSISVNGDGYRTTREIAVGSPLAKVLEAYPEIGMAPDGRTDPDNAAYVLSDELSGRFLQFEVADGRVAEIRVYRMLN